MTPSFWVEQEAPDWNGLDSSGMLFLIEKPLTVSSSNPVFCRKQVSQLLLSLLDSTASLFVRRCCHLELTFPEAVVAAETLEIINSQHLFGRWHYLRCNKAGNCKSIQHMLRLKTYQL